MPALSQPEMIGRAELMAKKPTAREKQARATRAAFLRVCTLLADGPIESVREITADSKTAGISQSGFYKMLEAGRRSLPFRRSQQLCRR